MRILELYAGSRSIGKIAEQRGHEVFSVDIKKFEGVDLVIDIENLTVEMLPFIPDMVWIGIPCTSWSIAGIRFHRWPDLEPKSDFAKKSDRLLSHNLKLINDLLELRPEMIWYMENPRGVLRKMPELNGVPKTTVWYCRYNDPWKRAKPTDIWSNNIYSVFNSEGWEGRPRCFNDNDNCDHQKAPRGSSNGVQGQANNHERSKMPPELCTEIIIATEKRISI